MAQILVRNHNVVTLRKFLEPQLRNLRKKTLTVISDGLNVYIPSNCKKDKQIDCILIKIIDLFNTGRKNGITEEISIENIVSKLTTLEQSQMTMIRKTLLAYCEFFKNTPPTFFNVQVRKPLGIVIEDIQKAQSCICNSETYAGPLVRCTVCLLEFHKDCLKIPPNEVFECPFCFMKTMDPLHDVVGTAFVGYLRMSDTVHNFRFMINEPDLPNPKYQVEIRCVRLDGKNNYEMTWPDCGYIKLNENKILDLKPLVNNSSLRRRKDEPKIIDRKMMRVDSDNYIQVMVIPPQLKEQVRVSSANHLIGVFIVRIDTAHELFERTQNKVISKDESRQLLVGYMNANSTEELEIDKLAVSMRCVFSMMPIKIPARSKQCIHFNCFDLEHMIIANTRTQPRRWRCPICRKKAHSLVVDPTLLEIIKESYPKQLSDVTFFNDGSYKVNQEKEQPDQDYESETEKQPKITGPLICLDDQQEVNKQRSYEAVCIQQTIQNPERGVQNAYFGLEYNPFAQQVYHDNPIVIQTTQTIQKPPEGIPVAQQNSVPIQRPVQPELPKPQDIPKPIEVSPKIPISIAQGIKNVQNGSSIVENPPPESRSQKPQTSRMELEPGIDLTDLPKIKDAASIQTTDSITIDKKKIHKLPHPFEIVTPQNARPMHQMPMGAPGMGSMYDMYKPVHAPFMKPMYPPPGYPYPLQLSSLYSHMLPPYGHPYESAMYMRDCQSMGGMPPMPPMGVPPVSYLPPVNPSVVTRQTASSSRAPLEPKKTAPLPKPQQSKTSEVIEIVDSDEETELQKTRRKERQQINKLNQTAAKSLASQNITCDAERLVFFKIVQMWRKSFSTAAVS